MNRQTLKQWFSRGKKPTETQFAELIDSFWHKQDDDLTINDIINLATELSQKASKTELATAQADADVVYKAVIRQATVVNLSDAVNEYTAPAVGGYLVVDETENTGGIFTVDKTGNSGSQEKILVQLPADNSKPTAIKLIGASGNIVHWKDYAPGTLIKVWWFEGDSFEIDGEGSLPTISDQRLKGDILDYDVANETAVLKFLDSLDVQIDGETAMQLGQWGVRFSNFLELMKHGVATIWNGMGQMILHATNTGTHLYFEGKKILSADQRATALQQHRKVYCFEAEYVPFEELQEIYNQQGMPSNIRRTYGSSETIYNGYLLAVTENGGQPIKLQPYSLSYPYTGYEYYRVGTVKDHYFYEDNTVVAGGIDNEELAQFATLNLGEGWLLNAGIGTFGGSGQTTQPALPYGYASEQWYMGLYDPLRRAIITKQSQNESGATQFWHNGAERMRFTAEGVQLFGKVSGANNMDFFTNNTVNSYQEFSIGNGNNPLYLTALSIYGSIVRGNLVSSLFLGYRSSDNHVYRLNNSSVFHRIDIEVQLYEPASVDLELSVENEAYSNVTFYGGRFAKIPAGSVCLKKTVYVKGGNFIAKLKNTDYTSANTNVNVKISSIMMAISPM